MKFIKTLAAVLFVSAVFTVAALADGLRVTLSDATVDIGYTTARVAVRVDDNPGVALLTFGVRYDPAVMTLTNVIPATAVFDEASTVPGNREAVPYRFLAYRTGRPVPANGALMTLVFTLKNGTQPGRYPVSVESAEAYAADETPVAVTGSTGTVTLRGRSFGSVSIPDVSAVYDGKPHPPRIVGTLPSTAAVTGLESPVAPGTYPMTVTVSAPGYETLTFTPTVTIALRPIYLAGFAAQNKTYDGSDEAVINPPRITGILDGEDVTVTPPSSGRFENAHAGSDKTVIYPAFKPEGKDSGNYYIATNLALTASILPRALTVAANDTGKKQGDPDPALTYTLVDGTLVDGDAFHGSLTRAPGEEPGVYDIRRGSLDVSGDYAITFRLGRFTVSSKETQTVTVSPVGRLTYGDAPFTLDVTPDPTANLTDFTFSSSAPAVVSVDADGRVTVGKAGSATITVSEPGNETYAPATVLIPVTVAKKPLAASLVFETEALTYGDDPDIATVELSGYVNGEDAGVLASLPAVMTAFTEKITASDYGVNTYTVSGGVADNYTFTYPDPVTLPVKKRPVTVNGLALYPIEQGGDPCLVTEGVTLDGVLEEDTLALDFSKAAVTVDGDTATVENLTLTGAADRYVLAGEPVKLPVTTVEKLTAALVAAALPKAITTSEDLAFTLPVGFAVTGYKSENAAVGADGKVTPDAGDTVGPVTVTVTNENDRTDTAAAAVSVTVPARLMYTVTLKAQTGGTVSGEGRFDPGTRVTVTAKAQSGYNFAGWYADGKNVSSLSKYTFTVRENVTLTARFEKGSSAPIGGFGGFSGDVKPTVAPVTASPARGELEKDAKITLSTATADATIYYTTDGSTPTNGSLRYLSPISMPDHDLTVKAFAVKSGMNDGSVVTFTYTFKKPAAPEKQQVKPVTATPSGGKVSLGDTITLQTETEGAAIYYTTDNHIPTRDSTRYTEPLTVDDTVLVIRAIAVREDMTDSAVSSFIFDARESQTVSDGSIRLKDNASTVRYLAAFGREVRPDDPATRYDVLEMLDRLFIIEGFTPGESFPDVDEKHETVVRKYRGAHIVDGYPEDNTFRGENGITRAEFTKLLAVMLSVEEDGEGETALTDIEGHWAMGYIRAFVGKGYLIGDPDGSFRPDDPVTRAEAVTVLNRVSDHYKDESLRPVYTDLAAEHWAFAEIMNVIL